MNIPPAKSPLCQQFHANPRLNPTTGRPIDDRTFKQLLRECGPIPNLVVPRPQPTGVVTRPIIPTQENVPQPTVPQPRIVPEWEDYYPQDYPTPEEFKFQALPENTEYIQSLIETGRSIFPSLETFILAAEHINALPEERRRSRFPLYLKDASMFEIFQIYKRDRVEKALQFIRDLTELYEEEEHPKEMRTIDEYMKSQGYRPDYFGFARFVRNDVATPHHIHLTQETFRNSITPGQQILMEAWRIKAATGSVTRGGQGNISLLRLREIRDQYYRPNRLQGKIRPPGIASIGFSVEALRDAVLASIEQLPDKQLPRMRPMNRQWWGRGDARYVMPTHYIMYQGEKTIDERGRDLRQKKLPMHRSMSKAYYMMLYNELMIRGLLVTK